MPRTAPFAAALLLAASASLLARFPRPPPGSSPATRPVGRGLGDQSTPDIARGGNQFLAV